MPTHSPRRAVLSPIAAVFMTALALAATACGDDGTPATAFSVSITEPSAAETVFARVATDFTADIQLDASVDPDAVAFTYDWNFGDGTTLTGAAAEVTHTYDNAGAFQLEVVARRTDQDGVSRISRELLVQDTTDLVLGEATLTVSDTVVRTDDTFRLSANLFNEGAATTQAFDVGFYLIDTSYDPVELMAFTPDEARAFANQTDVIEVGRTTFDGFSAAPSQAVIDNSALRVPETVPSGTYQAVVVVDPASALPIVETAGNTLLSVASGQVVFENTANDNVDLVVGGVTARPARANVLSTVTLDASIRNDGLSFAPPFNVAVYLSRANGTLQDEDREIYVGRVDGIPAAGAFPLTDFEIVVEPPLTELGEYFVIVQADADGEMDEVNLTNNVAASSRITITDEALPGTDIVPTAFAVLPGTTFIGGSVQIDVTVANLGTEPAEGQFNCSFYLSEDEALTPTQDRLIQTILLGPMAAGDEVVQSIDAFVPPLAPGEYVPIVACDPSLLIPEADDFNNVRRASPISIAESANIDLRPAAFSVSPQEVDNEDPVTVSVEICNDGTNGSTPTNMRVFLTQDIAPSPSDSILVESRVPPIDAGACVTIQADVPAICDTFVSEYNVFAVLDVTGLVEESNETNNVAQLVGGLQINGVICDCENDVFEINDTPINASFVNPADGPFVDLAMCNANVDYYRLSLLADQTVRVAITFDHDRGDLDMELFALDRSTLLSASTSTGDREEVSFLRIPERGEYLLRVQGKTADDRNVYGMEVEVTSPQEGTDLIVIDVTSDTVRPVLGETVEVCFDVVNLGETPAGTSVARVYLTESPTLDPIEDVLIATDNTPAVVSRERRCVDAQIPETSGGGARYIAVVVDARDDVVGELSEDNNVGYSPVINVDDACFDVLEPNNTLDEPRLLEFFTEPPVTFTELRVCSDNRDFYEFCVSDGDFLSVEAVFDPTAGDIDMKLYDAGEEVDRSEGIGPSEVVGVEYVTGDRCYVAELYVAGAGRDTPYTLNVDTGRAPDALACSRIEEPNDGFGTAAPLRDYLDECMAVCPTSDEDYYTIELSPGAEVSFTLEGLEGAVPETELRMTLWGPSRNFLTNTVSATEVLRHDVALAGTHYLRVRSNGDGPRNQAYCLRVDGVEGTDLVPSAFALETSVASPGQTLRFDFVLSNARDVASVATDYSLYLSDDPVISADDTLLRTVDLAPLAGFAQRVEGRRFDVPAELVDGGDFFVILRVDDAALVSEFNESNNLLLAELTVTPRCLPDIAEPNNYPDDAADLSLAEGETLGVCGDTDVDWFVFNASADTSTVSIQFADADGDLDLYVYERDGDALDEVGFSDSITDDEQVTFASEIGRDYWVEVRQHTDRTPAYTLTLE